MLQLFRKFGWRVAGGLDAQEGGVSLCFLAMPFLRDALLGNDVIVTTWASYTVHQLTDSLLRSTVASLKSQARGEGEVTRGQATLHVGTVVCSCHYGGRIPHQGMIITQFLL